MLQYVSTYVLREFSCKACSQEYARKIETKIRQLFGDLPKSVEQSQIPF